MNIFINALSARMGGGQTYIINLIKKKKYHKKHKIFILTQKSFKLQNLPKNVTQITRNLRNPFLRKLWEESVQRILLKKLNINILFCPGGMLPYKISSNIKQVVTFQNMLPFDKEQKRKYSFYSYRFLRDILLYYALKRSMIKANLVIFLSEYAKDFVMKDIKKLHGNSVIIPHGVDSMFSTKSVNKPIKLSLQNSPYFTYVSYIDHYKAHLEVIIGFSIYCKNGGQGHLYFFGNEYKPYADMLRKKIIELELEDRIYIYGVVEHKNLPSIYQNAEVNIFASYTENCPNILLELLSSGRPSLVSNKGPMPEIAEESVMYFDPSNPIEFSENLFQLVSDENLQHRLIYSAEEVIKNYTWELAAKRTWDSIYNK
jgi:glycosyltransferase involved in cell wall biosynthesis